MTDLSKFYPAKILRYTVVLSVDLQRPLNTLSRTFNPADLPSHGLSGDRLLNSNLWWEGPPFFCDLKVNGHVRCNHILVMLLVRVSQELPELTHVLAIHGKLAHSSSSCNSFCISIFKGIY